VEDMKLALYEMDEEILTPELLRQLVAFAPNKSEVQCITGLILIKL
jgi:hypothetical protein